MGLFDFVFGKKERAVEKPVRNDLLDKTEVTPGLSLPKALAAHWEEIQKTRLSYISITATPSDKISRQQSSFGHFTCLPKGFPYPMDIHGKPMFPLAQINFSEVPVLEGYPQFGFLQFYITTDDLFGIDFDNPQSQKNFRVLYFEPDNVSDYQSDFSAYESVLNSEYVPIFKPHQLYFSIKEEYVGMEDVRGEGENFSFSKIIAQYPSIENQLHDEAWEIFQSNGHKIGGYAHFAQDDPRSDELKDYIVLLQIDSDDQIMWGDSGVANFFIHPADLAKKDFSKVLYSWDCY